MTDPAHIHLTGAHRGQAKLSSVLGHIPESEYRALFQNADWGICILEAVEDGEDFVVVDLNPAASCITRLTRDHLLGQRISDAFPIASRLGVLERVRRTWRSGQLELGPAQDEQQAQPLGNYHLHRLPSGRIALLFDGQRQNTQFANQISDLAYFDALTQLPNRRLLLDRLQQALVSSKRTRQFGAVLFIDLDNFKTLNDTRGHDIGDKLLEEVGRRLRLSIREVDTVARFGGDEFVVLLKNLSSSMESAAAECEDVTAKILTSLYQPYSLAGQDFWCSASIGIALFQGKETSVDELLKRADIAMYQAKAAGRNSMRFFDPAMQAAVNERAMMESELRQALERRDFKLRFQPQVDHNGTLIGVEAFVYWQHPSGNTLHAAEFVPLAEDTGLIHLLGQQVLRMGCAQLASWQPHPALGHIPLAINISAKQFRRPDFVDQVQATLDDSGADPRLLRLEVTEQLIFDKLADTQNKMEALKALGVRFSLDDFGTGFLSLSELKRLPIDQVKIDKSFVQNYINDAGDAAVARSVIALGHMFGIPVIAEGVETAAQRDFLLMQGCSNLQGNYLAPPMPLEAFMQAYA